MSTPFSSFWWKYWIPWFLQVLCGSLFSSKMIEDTISILSTQKYLLNQSLMESKYWKETFNRFMRQNHFQTLYQHFPLNARDECTRLRPNAAPHWMGDEDHLSKDSVGALGLCLRMYLKLKYIVFPGQYSIALSCPSPHLSGLVKFCKFVAT